jgi:hypothetical protein
MSAPVKNTFVHFETAAAYEYLDEQQQEPCSCIDYAVRRRTKRSATAPLFLQLSDEEDLLSDGICTSSLPTSASDKLGFSSSCSTSDEEIHSSDDDAFLSTPTASEFITRFSIPGESRFKGDLEDAISHRAVTEHARTVGGQQQVMVEVPVSVPAEFASNAASLGNRIQVALLQTLAQSNFDATSEDVVVDVKFRFSVVASQVPAVPVSLQLAEAVPPVPAPASPGKPTSTTAVCCHWKQKGFCAYQNTCKFSHPEHKRGVGAGSSGKKTRSRAANQSQPTVVALTQFRT